MSAADDINFAITLKSTWWNDNPKIRIYLNDEVIQDLNIEDEITVFQFKKALEEGKHKLSIELHSKHGQTKMDKTGEITHDLLVDIKDIEIDDVSLGNLVWTASYFEPDMKYSKKNNMNLEPKITHYATMGYNGKYQLEFETPSYIWLLENL